MGILFVICNELDLLWISEFEAIHQVDEACSTRISRHCIDEPHCRFWLTLFCCGATSCDQYVRINYLGELRGCGLCTDPLFHPSSGNYFGSGKCSGYTGVSCWRCSTRNDGSLHSAFGSGFEKQL